MQEYVLYDIAGDNFFNNHDAGGYIYSGYGKETVTLKLSTVRTNGERAINDMESWEHEVLYPTRKEELYVVAIKDGVPDFIHYCYPLKDIV